MTKFFPIRLYLAKKPIFLALIASFILNIALAVWLLWNIGAQAEPIFLHYNILFGVDYVGEWWQIFFLPLTGLLIIFINLAIGWYFFSRDKYISFVLNSVSVLCQALLCIMAWLLVFLNV